MNDSFSIPDPVLDPLFACAREHRPDTSRAEYAFETRLAARLHASRRPAWGMVSWRMIPVFTLVVLVLAGWRVEAGSASRDAAQVSAVENPEAADLLASFN